MDDYKKKDRPEIFSQSVRAGKRTYFFDVKETRNGEYYLTLTESKKQFSEGKQPFFEKHKIFLYKEDFQKFTNAFQTALEFIDDKQPYQPEENDDKFTNLEFEDLDQ